jgi:predicted RNA-binding Zn-ribbon protein involved in translation (DUF1610 family)
MCRYGFGSVKTHRVCLPCRRSLKQSTGSTAPCPECGGELVNMGRDFKAPRRSNARQWRKLELLVAAGRRAVDPRYRTDGPLFDSCGCTGPGPRPRTLADAKSLLGVRRSRRRVRSNL